MSRYSYIIGIAQRITHEECAATCNMVYELSYAPSIEMVKQAYASDDIRWHPLIENDVTLVIDGYKPEYFLHWQDWIDLYRENHSIQYVQPKGYTINGAEKDPLWEMMKDDHEEFAYQLWRQSGWACPKEQAYFYKSDEWTRTAKAQRYIDGYQCRKCRCTNRELHVHHEHPIKSAYDYRFLDNFADWYLTLYCKECHDWFHENFARTIIANDFIPHTPEEIEEDKRTYREYWQRYHAEGQCRFCNSHLGDVSLRRPG